VCPSRFSIKHSPSSCRKHAFILPRWTESHKHPISN
jgi:hypothetical protein